MTDKFNRLQLLRRVLHVQPEAPLEVIRAVPSHAHEYVAPASRLGGDTAAAALLNEAYAVLKDPVRRAWYDAGPAAPPANRDRRPDDEDAAAPRSRRPSAPVADVVQTPACPMCRTALPG